MPAQSPTADNAELANRQDLYQALLARDARFDGRFFVGVTSTGVYCRPVCRVRMPLMRNCRFFAHATGAESAGFRPCLRCRPELAPGLSRTDAVSTLAQQAACLMDSAATVGESLSMTSLAARLGVTDRHLRRIFDAEYGVSPSAYLTTRRLLHAKQLLTDTGLPVSTVAHAAGFGSVRQFNAAFSEHYRLNPTALRQHHTNERRDAYKATWHARLGYRPPFDAAGLRRFLHLRALPGIEQVEGTGSSLHYLRSLALNHAGSRFVGWLRVSTSSSDHELEVTVSEGLAPAMGQVLVRVRRALDLDAEPELVDPAVAALGLGTRPGLRLPGAFDGFETAVRVILGQQVSVSAARTLCGRLVNLLGDTWNETFGLQPAALTHLFPTAQAVAQADPADLGRLGIVRQRVEALQAMASAVLDGRIRLERDAPLEPTLHALRSLRGIGEWTAQLIAMRALAWPDAFPSTDLALLKALGTRDPNEAQRRAQACRPWRSYAVMRCWQTLEPDDEHTQILAA